MSEVKVVGLGLATLDVLMRLGEMPTWERSVPLSGFSLDGGGPVGTAMVAVSRLGVPAGYVGIAGTDKVGELKIGSLVENGVDVSRLVRRPGPEKQVVIVHVQEDTGERLFDLLWGIVGWRVELDDGDTGIHRWHQLSTDEGRDEFHRADEKHHRQDQRDNPPSQGASQDAQVHSGQA